MAVSPAAAESKKKLKIPSLEMLSDKFGLCSKTEACFQIKGSIPVFTPNRKVPFDTIKQVEEELDG